MAYSIPVYLFTGFLEGGKTSLIRESMENLKFDRGEKTLCLICEEGEEELLPERFAKKGKNCFFETLEDEEELTYDLLCAMQKKYKPTRVIIEYNGMWQLKNLYENMPESWAIYQQIMIADATTFFIYNQNMRSLMVDKLMDAEMVIINRTPDSFNKEEAHKIVRGISRRAQIAYEDLERHITYDEIEDPLPFDVNAPVIEIKDEDFALWYRDISEEMDKYDGKTVKFKGLVVRDNKLPDYAVILGRHIMTCCADDIAYSGLVCNFTLPVPLQTRDWVTVTAKIKLEAHKLYGGRRGPVLYAPNYTAAKPPQQEVATFY